MQVLTHNLPAMFTQRELKVVTGQIAKNSEKLSSGYKINRSADDAAGLTISEKMRSQIRGLNKAAENIQDGISFLQTGEGALTEVHDMLHRIKELAIKASNGTNTDQDREAVDREVQQLKKEMNRVFAETDFNTLKIFRAPYVPNIDDGVLNDYELFNNGSGSPAAGIMINNKRYTWEELGITGGTVSEDWEKKFEDDNGELIWLTLKKGQDVSKMERHYLLEADETGIKVNKLYAGKWDGSEPPITQTGNTYKFSYHGLDLSIEADGEDDRSMIIERLNGDNLFVNGWKATPSGGSGVKAVSSTRDYVDLNVTNANKYEIENYRYRIVADEDGVGLVQTAGDDGITHGKMAWSDFTNVSGGGSFPISDWGTENEGSNPVTLDQTATYRYTDSGNAGYYTDHLSFTFHFNANEASKEQAIVGLTQDLSAADIYTTNPTVTADSGLTVEHAGFALFHFQRDVLLLDYGTDGTPAPTSATVERTRTVDDVVWDHENRLKLSAAYARLDTATSTSTITRYELADTKFYDANGVEFDPDPSDIAYDNSGLADQESAAVVSNSSSYVANTGLNPAHTAHTDNAGSLSFVSNGSGTTVERTLTYQEGGETKTGKVVLTFNEKQATHTVTDSSYQRNGSRLVNYMSDGAGGYAVVASSAYYVRDTGAGCSTDYDGGTYRALQNTDGSAQRYVSYGSGYVAVKRYELAHYDHSVKNSAGNEFMHNQSGIFLDTDGQITSNTFTITDGSGHTVRYNTDRYYRDLYFSTNSGGGANLLLRYTDGSEDRNNTLTITTGRSYASFTKNSKNGGSATDTDLILKVNAPDKRLYIQAGPAKDHGIDIEWPSLSNSIIGIGNARTTTLAKARATIAMADTATEMISEVRSRFGAMQNRLEGAYNIDRNSEENTQAAESRIRDADMADEMVTYSKNSIIQQAGLSMLAQANLQPLGLLSLLS